METVYVKEEIEQRIHLVKRCVAHMNVYRWDDEYDSDPDTSKAIRLLEELDDILCGECFYKTDIVPQNINEKGGWRYIKDGDFPECRTDILFSTYSENVFEGYFERMNFNEPYLTENRKIAFKEYEDGGKWFSNKYRALYDMEDVVAWCYKPQAAPAKGGSNE